MFEAYKVGVTVALNNHVSRGLLLMQRDLGRADAQADRLRRTLGRVEKLALGGAVAGGMGFLGLKAVGALVKPAEEYVHQLELARSKLANLAPAKAQLEIAQMTAAAWKTSAQVMTSTPTGNLKAVQELRMTLGSTERAVAALPELMKLEAVLNSTMHGEKGVKTSDVAFTAAKALEIRGASNDPARFARELGLVAQATLASNGRYSPHMQLQVQKYLKGSIGGTLSDEFLYGVMPTLAQEMGGSTAATALTAMSRAVVRGRIDKKSLAYWKQYGLVESVSGVTGESAMIRAKKSELFQENPLDYAKWLNTTLIAKGLADPRKRAAAIDRLMGNQNSGWMTSILTGQQDRIRKDMELTKQAGSIPEYDRLVKSDPVMARMAAAAQWDSLKTVIGIEVVPLLIPAITGLAEGLRALSGWAKDNPGVTKALVLGFTALSGALLFSGVVWGLQAAFVGLKTAFAVTGAGSLAGGIAAFAGSAAAAAAVLGAAALALGVIAYHKEIAGAIDGTSWGRKLGDGLMGARDWLSEGDGLSGVRRVAPPRGQNQPIHTTVNLDGRKIAEAVSGHQRTAMNAPANAAGFFDIGSGMASPSATFGH